nr:unnamed protein product [Digitaria exilis]
MDPYLKNDGMGEEEEEEEEDRTVKPNDFIIASLHVQEKTSGNYLKESHRNSVLGIAWNKEYM